MTLITIPSELSYQDGPEMDFYSNLISNSSLTGVTQRVIQSGSHWGIRWQLPNMPEDTARQWRGFLMAQEGGANEFLHGPFGYSPVYSGPNPLVKGGSQTGVTINCDGVTPSTTILRVGEYFSTIDNELKMQTGVDAVSDVSGNVTFTFAPMLRSSPADNSTIELQNPKTRFMLEEPQIGWRHGLQNYSQMKQILAIEVITS